MHITPKLSWKVAMVKSHHTVIVMLRFMLGVVSADPSALQSKIQAAPPELISRLCKKSGQFLNFYLLALLLLTFILMWLIGLVLKLRSRSIQKWLHLTRNMRCIGRRRRFIGYSKQNIHGRSYSVCMSRALSNQKITKMVLFITDATCVGNIPTTKS